MNAFSFPSMSFLATLNNPHSFPSSLHFIFLHLYFCISQMCLTQKKSLIKNQIFPLISSLATLNYLHPFSSSLHFVFLNLLWHKFYLRPFFCTIPKYFLFFPTLGNKLRIALFPFLQLPEKIRP